MTLSPSRPSAALEASGVEQRRVPHLTSAIIGNGSLLATLSARGEVERLFWPNIDWGQHLGELRLGVAQDSLTTWLDESHFSHSQRYVEETTVVETRAEDATLSARVFDFVCPEHPVLYRWVTTDATRARLVVYIRPEIDESARYGAVYTDGITGALVFYRRGKAIAVGLSPRPQACAGRLDAVDGSSAVFRDASAGRIAGGAVEYGPVDGALSADIPAQGALCVVACATTPAAALERLATAVAEDPSAALFRRRAADATTISSAREIEGSADTVRLYRRSLLAFDSLADRSTGAVIAAPEMDADFDHCGGYGFVWGRDMAYSLLAFLASNRTDLARRGVEWLIKAQSPEGLWLHRHCADGSLAPSWGLHQLDETGAILVSFAAAVRTLPDLKDDQSLLAATEAAGEFLCGFRDAETGLPLPSIDLWEERLATHAYTAAAVAAGLRGAAAVMRDTSRRRAATYLRAAKEIAHAIDEHLWDEAAGRYRRSCGRAATTVSTPLRYPDEIAFSARAGSTDVDDDLVVDASLLGLAWPYAVVPPTGTRMRNTVRAIEAELITPGGGLKRYANDSYAGGNAWVLTTLWLALWYRQIGDRAAYDRCMSNVVAWQTAVGLLPEQIGPDGAPSWVVPLTWSHAMFVLAVVPDFVTPSARQKAGAAAA